MSGLHGVRTGGPGRGPRPLVLVRWSDLSPADPGPRPHPPGDPLPEEGASGPRGSGWWELGTRGSAHIPQAKLHAEGRAGPVLAGSLGLAFRGCWGPRAGPSWGRGCVSAPGFGWSHAAVSVAHGHGEASGLALRGPCGEDAGRGQGLGGVCSRAPPASGGKLSAGPTATRVRSLKLDR